MSYRGADKRIDDGCLQVALLFLIMLCACASGSTENPERRPFFQPELEETEHGRKTWFDRTVELDPGEIRVRVAKDYLDHPPATIAVLPFVDLGSANFVVNKVALTRRKGAQRDAWAWTHANRLRKMLLGFLAQREFMVINPMAIDAILADHGVDSGEKLRRVPLESFRTWFGADAIVYGSVDHYEAYYFGLASAWQVKINARIVSTDSGETLVDARTERWWTQVMPAIDPLDIGMNSGETLLNLRDVVLVRSEEEVCREIVVRIPISRRLQQQVVARARAREVQVETEQFSDLTWDRAPRLLPGGGPGEDCQQPLSGATASTVLHASDGMKAAEFSRSCSEKAPSEPKDLP